MLPKGVLYNGSATLLRSRIAPANSYSKEFGGGFVKESLGSGLSGGYMPTFVLYTSIKVTNFANSVRVRFSFFSLPPTPASPTTKPAMIAMIAITTSSSMSVKAFRLARGFMSGVDVAVFIGPEIHSAKFLFHSFAQPLLDHA